MDYEKTKGGSGKWIGFDADMVRSLQRALGVDVEFVEIDWDNKIMELDAKKHRLGVWNGMTISSEVKNGMSVSKCLPQNTQVVKRC